MKPVIHYRIGEARSPFYHDEIGEDEIAGLVVEGEYYHSDDKFTIEGGYSHKPPDYIFEFPYFLGRKGSEWKEDYLISSIMRIVLNSDKFQREYGKKEIKGHITNLEQLDSDKARHRTKIYFYGSPKELLKEIYEDK